MKNLTINNENWFVNLTGCVIQLNVGEVGPLGEKFNLDYKPISVNRSLNVSYYN